MKIPWLSKMRNIKEKETPEKKFTEENKAVFKFNNKIYAEKSLSKEVKELIKQIKKSDKIINNQKIKIQLLKDAEIIVINDLRKNLLKTD